MDVYLVPIGRDRYELYCEVPDEPEATVDETSTGFVSRMKHRFMALLAEAERVIPTTNQRARSREPRRSSSATSPKRSQSNGCSGTFVVRTRPVCSFPTISMSLGRPRSCAANSRGISRSTASG
jgi:hypothetical protein